MFAHSIEKLSVGIATFCAYQEDMYALAMMTEEVRLMYGARLSDSDRSRTSQSQRVGHALLSYIQKRLPHRHCETGKDRALQLGSRVADAPHSLRDYFI